MIFFFHTLLIHHEDFVDRMYKISRENKMYMVVRLDEKYKSFFIQF